MQNWSFTKNVEKANYSFHQMFELEVFKTKNVFMKVEVFIY
jgi:hypothetical protein